ncbi:MAG: energy-coupling factor transporter transmembrane protein EcfT [Firmicutes bacterium]|nr:energy-coupling factor transporter transmembrane protein EcfT [Bacillota bacterium]
MIRLLQDKLLLGQYYPGDSPVHKLNALSKWIAALTYMVALFVANNWLGWGGLALLAAFVAWLSHIPLKALGRGLKGILVFAVITMLFNFFFYPGEALWQWRFLRLSREGIYYGLAMGLRLFLLVAFSSLLTLTSKPVALTDGMEKMLSPLRFIGVPAAEIAMTTSIALRFIPTILEEFDRIVLAQRARGGGLAQGNLWKRLASFVPLLVPLLISAFRRAEDLAQAMEAKCYQSGQKRSRWRQAPWRLPDTLTVVLMLAILAVLIGGRIWG